MILVLFILTTVSLEQCLGDDKASKGELEQYLASLGYEGLAFKSTEKNQLLLEGKIGEQKWVLFVDTGWGFTTLSERAARGLKRLGEVGGSLEDDHFGTLTDPSIVIMEKLAIGKAQFMNQPARVEALQMDYINTPYDGVLGCDFYWRNFCVIDCYGRKLYVRSTKPSEEQAQALAETLRRSGWLEVPTKANHHLMIDVEINAHPVQLLVDTGGGVSLLDEGQRKPLELSSYSEKKTGTTIPQDVNALVIGTGKTGAHQLRVVTLKTLQIGSRRLTNVHLGIGNLKAWGEIDHKELTGVIGEDLLEPQGALIDFSNDKVWFRPRKH